MSYAPRPVFFSSSVTSARFTSGETVADSSDRLMTLARVGATMLMFVFSSAVGKGSREQDLFLSRMKAVAVVDVNASRV